MNYCWAEKVKVRNVSSKWGYWLQAGRPWLWEVYLKITTNWIKEIQYHDWIVIIQQAEYDLMPAQYHPSVEKGHSKFVLFGHDRPPHLICSQRLAVIRLQPKSKDIITVRQHCIYTLCARSELWSLSFSSSSWSWSTLAKAFLGQ